MFLSCSHAEELAVCVCTNFSVSTCSSVPMEIGEGGCTASMAKYFLVWLSDLN